MKKFRKLSVMLSLVLCVSMLFSGSVFATNEKEDNKYNLVEQELNSIREQYVGKLDKVWLNDIIDGYLESESFRKEYMNDSQGATNKVRLAIEGDILIANSRTTRQFDVGPYGWVDTTPVEQLINHCGPASVIQALIPLGVYSKGESQQYYSENQRDLAKTMMTNGQTDQAAIAKALNQKSDRIWTQKWTTNKTDPAIIASNIYRSLAPDCAPVIGTDTTKLKYYKGARTSGHYITVIAADLDSQIITVLDPNINKDKAYFGYHDVSYEEIRNAVAGKTITYVPIDINDPWVPWGASPSHIYK